MFVVELGTTACGLSTAVCRLQTVVATVHNSSRVGFHLARIKPSSKDAVLWLLHLSQAHNKVAIRIRMPGTGLSSPQLVRLATTACRLHAVVDFSNPARENFILMPLIALILKQNKMDFSILARIFLVI